MSAAKVPAVADVSDDEFELMFGKASAEEPLSDNQDDPPKEDPPKEEAKEEPPKEEPPKEEQEEAEEEPGEAKAEEVEEEESEEAKKAEEAEAKQAKAEEKARKKAEAAEAKKADEEVRKKAAEEAEAEARRKREELDARATLTDDEKALQKEIEKDFPDVAKVMEIQQRISDAKWERQFSEFQNKLIEQLKPTISTVNAVAADTWEKQVYGAHPDAQDLLPQIEEWVEQQPLKRVRDAYNDVLDNGTAQETIELFNMFKKERGLAGKAPEEKKPAASNKEKEDKLNSMEGVRGRQDTNKNEAPSGFDDAFEKASKALGS